MQHFGKNVFFFKNVSVKPEAKQAKRYVATSTGKHHRNQQIVNEH